VSTDPVQAASEESPAGRPGAGAGPGPGDTHDPSAGAAGGESAAASDAQGQPSEDQLRAAYEAEMSRITSTDMILQAAVSLLNIGGYRLGLSGAGAGGGGEQAPGGEPARGGEVRDLEQVRDAIDGARALMGILERRNSSELRPLRDALSQLQIAYAREAGASVPAGQAGAQGQQGAGGAEGARGAPPPPAARPDAPSAAEPKPQGPGPAQSSGRLWVPGR